MASSSSSKSGVHEAIKIWSLLCFCLLFSLLPRFTKGYMISSDPDRRAEYLDPDSKYLLEWSVDWVTNRITFNVTVKTQGWILFGLANDYKNETGKDVVIGGVLGRGRDGKPYFSDRHEESGGDIGIVDNSQDYKLEEAWEDRSVTFLSFSRNLDICDPEDYQISENKVSLIWAYGDYDNYDVPRREGPRRRGYYDVYLLEKDYSPKIVRDAAGNPRIVDDLQLQDNPNPRLWTVSVKTKLPSNQTSYLCTIHKAPRLRKKHHVIGFDVRIPDPRSVENIHHFTVYKCNAPRGSSDSSDRDVFQPFVGSPEETCYILNKPPSSTGGGMPYHLCGQVYNVWAIGGRPFFFPPEAGLPLGENPDEYYLVQVHYDNPEQKENVEVSIQMDYWYTSKLRPNDAGFMGFGQDVPALPPTTLVPPQSTGHRVLSHCSSECTQRMFPPEGITAFAGLLHSHNSGVRIRLRHFDHEKKVELPWVTYDDNYSNKFQQIRIFPKEVKFLPGDQLTTECTYDNTWTNGTVVGGFSTSQEMCFVSVFYYNQIKDYSMCSSQIVNTEGRQRFLNGLQNITWIEDKLEWVATSPIHLAGKTVTEISDNLPWNLRSRVELQTYSETTPMVATCSRDLFTRNRESLKQALQIRRNLPLENPPISVNTKDDYSGLVEYPFLAKAYTPPKRKCSII